MRRILVTLLFALSFTNLIAQKSSITVLAKAKNDGVWIRWAPTNPTVWQLGNKYGYTVERFTMLANGELENAQGEKLTTLPLKPWSLAQLTELAKTVREADVLGELIYDEDASKPFKTGDPYTALERNQDLENKYGIALLVCDLSPDVAKAAGLFIADRQAIKGKRYIYRVSLAHIPKGVRAEPGVFVLDVTEEKPMPAIKDLKAEFRDRTVSLSWSTLLHHGIYSSYKIEKSEDGKTFTNVSDLPYVHMSDSPENEKAFFVDSLSANNKTFHYRISGISPFGETGPVSNRVNGEGKDNLSGYLVIREGKVVSDKKVTLKWEFPSELEPQMKGFIVRRANNADGPYTDANQTLLSPAVREFTDITPYYNTYYIIVGVNTSGVESANSFPFLIQIEDNTPPETPEGLSGTVSKKGIVELKWSANKDVDLMGYRVFRSNSLKEEFVETTKSLVNGTSFVDSIAIKVLNRKIFYRIVAVDKNYNNSEFSAVLTLSKPDVVAPVRPVFTKAEIDKGTIVLQWINSSSNDIAKVELIRLEKEDRITRIIKTWAPSSVDSNHTELALTPGKTYQYKVIAYDSAGNSSEGYSSQLFFETGYRKSISEIKAEVDREKRVVKFQWKNPSTGLRVMIYRKQNDDALVLYKTIDGNIESFADKNISINNTYQYKVQVVFEGGVKSALSDEINVIY